MECSRCLFDTETTDATLDSEGICNYCRLFEKMEDEYPISKDGSDELYNICKKIKDARKASQKYDCIIGVSGGLDSSFLLYSMTQKFGLRPLAVHFDNSWNSPAAIHNLETLCHKFKVDLEVYKVDPEEFDDIILSFLKSGVLDIDAPTDIGLITALYMAAEKYDIHYILEGHSFRTEGVQPLNWAYVDGKYIDSIWKKYGNHERHTYPNLWIHLFLKWTIIKRIRRIRPLYYMDYNKETARKILAAYGFQNYSGHHYENKWSAFNYSYYLPKRAGIDGRKNELCAYVRREILSKDEAKSTLKQPISCDLDLICEVRNRLSLGEIELESLISAPIKNWRQFRTYKQFFERTKPLWYLLYKSEIIPESFYAKYCQK